MSAPFIIPFNYEPTSTVASTSGTYTVPAGKYAKVIISNAILPVLNSVALYTTRSAHSGWSISSTVTTKPVVNNSVHRVSITWNTLPNGGNSVYYAFGTTVTTNLYDFTTAGSSVSFTFTTPTDLTHLSAVCTGAISGAVGAFTIDTCDIAEIWLKAGDAFTYSAGSIVYSEFNSIS